MSSYMFQNVNSQQLNQVDSYRLSGGIKQYMEDGHSYNDAVQEVLVSEGWELHENDGRFTFYNKNTNQYANVNRHNGMMVPTTTDNLCMNAFRVVSNGLYYSIEPNEWTSTYDSRRGRRVMKKQLWQDKMDRKRQKGSLNVSRTS